MIVKTLARRKASWPLQRPAIRDSCDGHLHGGPEKWYLTRMAHRGFVLHGYVILESHLHTVARSPQIGKGVKSFKSYSAKRLLEVLEAHGARRLLRMLALFKRRYKTASSDRVWEESSHPQRIGHEDVMRQKLEYIHQNPVKRGYVDLPEHWR